MKRILFAAVVAAFAAMPLQASTLFAFTCVAPEEFGGGAILLQLYADRPNGSYNHSDAPSGGHSVEQVELDRTTAIIDAETGVLLLMFTGRKAKLPYEPGNWFEADCSPGAVRYFEIAEGL